MKVTGLNKGKQLVHGIVIRGAVISNKLRIHVWIVCKTVIRPTSERHVLASFHVSVVPYWHTARFQAYRIPRIWLVPAKHSGLGQLSIKHALYVSLNWNSCELNTTYCLNNHKKFFFCSCSYISILINNAMLIGYVSPRAMKLKFETFCFVYSIQRHITVQQSRNHINGSKAADCLTFIIRGVYNFMKFGIEAFGYVA